MKKLVTVFMNFFLLLFVLYSSSAYSQNTEWIVYTASNSGLPANGVNSITIDKNGNKWLATNGGVAFFNGEIWTVYNTSNQ